MKRGVCALVSLLLLSVAMPLRAEEKKSINFTVRDLKGKYLRLSDLRGKLVEIAFWATFCTSCQKKLWHLEKWYKKYQAKGFVVLGVSVDGPETDSRVQPMVARHKLTFPVVIDKDSTISKLFNPKRSTPFSVFTKNGRKVKVREGFQLSDVDGMERELVRLLE